MSNLCQIKRNSSLKKGNRKLLENNKDEGKEMVTMSFYLNIIQRKDLIFMKIKKLHYKTIFKSVFYEHPDILLQMLCDMIEFNPKYNLKVDYGSFPNRIDGNKVFNLLVEYNAHMWFCLSINDEANIINIHPNGFQIVRTEDRTMNYKPPYDLINEVPFIIITADYYNCNQGKEPVKYGTVINLPDDGKPSDLPLMIDFNLSECLKKVKKATNVRKIPKAIRWGAIMASEEMDDIEKSLGYDLLSSEQKSRFIAKIYEVQNDELILSDCSIEIMEGYLKQNILDQKAQKEIQRVSEETKEKTLEKIISKMLKNDCSISLIATVTEKTKNDIKKYQDKFQ